MCTIRHLFQAAPADRQVLTTLVEACIHHFSGLRGAAAGPASAWCGAALHTGACRQGFAFGSGPAGCIAPASAGQHAERRAWQAALRSGQPIGRHLYVELAPCAGDDGCAAWAQRTLPDDMNVWFLYDCADLMRLAHREGTATELATLHALWPPAARRPSGA